MSFDTPSTIINQFQNGKAKETNINDRTRSIGKRN